MVVFVDEDEGHGVALLQTPETTCSSLIISCAHAIRVKAAFLHVQVPSDLHKDPSVVNHHSNI